MRTATDKSVILVLYEAIETALTSFLTAKTIRSIEVWNGQDDNEEDERPRNYPYVAIEIAVDWEKVAVRSSSLEFSNVNQNQQKGDATVTIHYYVESLKNESLAFKEFEPKRFDIHRAINMLQDSEFFTHLQRKTTPTIPVHGRVFDLSTVYECTVIEQAALGTRTQLTAELQIDGELTIENKNLNL